MSKCKTIRTIKIIIVVIFVAVLFYFFYSKARKNIVDYVTTYTYEIVKSDVMERLDNSASLGVENYFSKYDHDFFEIVYDSSGQITFIKVNMFEVNMLEKEVSNCCFDSVYDYCVMKELNVPLGVFLGSVLFSGNGGFMDVDLIPVGVVRTTYISEYSECGINQTKQSLYLNVKAVISISIPFYTKDVEVDTNILVYENYIIGKIPDVFINI